MPGQFVKYDRSVLFWRPVMGFLNLRIRDVERATGVSEYRLSSAMSGYREANATEIRLVNNFLAAKWKNYFEEYGPLPEWLG
jgi:hypothetical protein